MARRVWNGLTAFVAAALAMTTVLAQPQPAQDGFVPVTGVPVTEQIPAAPLVIGAYACFLLLMMFYLWTIWLRIGKVEDDMRALERRQGLGRREP